MGLAGCRPFSLGTGLLPSGLQGEAPSGPLPSSPQEARSTGLSKPTCLTCSGWLAGLKFLVEVCPSLNDREWLLAHP